MLHGWGCVAHEYIDAAHEYSHEKRIHIQEASSYSCLATLVLLLLLGVKGEKSMRIAVPMLPHNS